MYHSLTPPLQLAFALKCPLCQHGPIICPRAPVTSMTENIYISCEFSAVILKVLRGQISQLNTISVTVWNDHASGVSSVTSSVFSSVRDARSIDSSTSSSPVTPHLSLAECQRSTQRKRAAGTRGKNQITEKKDTKHFFVWLSF